MFPSEAEIAQDTTVDKKKKKYSGQNCYDSVIHNKLNEQLPKEIAYLNFKDLQPKKTEEEIKEQERVKLQRILDQQSDVQEAWKEDSKKLDKEFKQQNQRPRLCAKPNRKLGPNHDRDSVRMGRVFSDQRERHYVEDC